MKAFYTISFYNCTISIYLSLSHTPSLILSLSCYSFPSSPFPALSPLPGVCMCVRVFLRRSPGHPCPDDCWHHRIHRWAGRGHHGHEVYHLRREQQSAQVSDRHDWRHHPTDWRWEREIRRIPTNTCIFLGSRVFPTWLNDLVMKISGPYFCNIIF